MAILTPLKLLFFAFSICCLLLLAQEVTALPSVQFSSSVVLNETETSGLVTATLERAGQTNISTTMTIDISGSATKDKDYVVVASSNVKVASSSSLVVTFPADNTTEKRISLYIINDRDVESGLERETIILKIRENAAEFNTGDYKSFKIFIADDDVSISCYNNEVEESGGKSAFSISRSGSPQAMSADHSIECSTKDDTAVAPGDYTAKNFDVSFVLSENYKEMNITIKDDKVPEANEKFKVTCDTNDVRVQMKNSCKDAVVTIKNDDTYVFFCPGGHAASVSENAGSYSVDICRVGVLSSTPTVRLCRTTEGGSQPTVGAGCKKLNFPIAKDRMSYTFMIIDDVIGENELKTFEIYLEPLGSSYTVNETANRKITLKDDDNTFYLTNVTDMVKTEGVGSADVNVTINRVGKISVAASVSLQLVFNATAESADCLGASPRVIQFNANETSKTITACKVVDDRLIEDDETFKVTISGVGTSNVKDDEFERTIKLISTDALVQCHDVYLKEASGPALMRLDRIGSTAVTANVSCSTGDNTAKSPADYQSQNSATVSFPPNANTTHFSVVVTDDNIPEGNKSFAVFCSSFDRSVFTDISCNGIMVYIIDDDSAIVFFCPGYSTSIEENVGSYTVRLCRVGVLEETHTIRVCRTSDAVSLPRDYPSVQAGCDDVVFTANDKVKELVIPVTNDLWSEQEYKTFNISMNTTDTGVGFNDTRSYVVTIHDDDNSFCFKRKLAKVYEEYDKFVNLTIRRTGEIFMSNASVIINTLPQTAVTPEDYTEPILNQRLTFYTGEIEKNISVNIVNDKLVEDDQTFQFSLAGVDGSTVFPECMNSTITIVSNDVNIFCRNGGGIQTVNENKGHVVLEFTREGSLQYQHTMRIRSINGTAHSGKDYTAIDKILTFAPNQTSITETVEIVNDDVLESNETFSLSVTSSDEGVHMTCPGTRFTIIDDDPFISCANQSMEVTEGNKTVYFTLKREGVVNTSFPIWFSTKDGTAFGKSDYKPQIKVNRTFLPGQVYMRLSVDLVDDEYNEDDETFSVIIGSDIPGALTSGDKCTAITIKDNDPNRMTSQQAQELLVRRRDFLIFLGVAFGVLVLFFLTFIFCICYILRRAK